MKNYTNLKRYIDSVNYRLEPNYKLNMESNLLLGVEYDLSDEVYSRLMGSIDKYIDDTSQNNILQETTVILNETNIEVPVGFTDAVNYVRSHIINIEDHKLIDDTISKITLGFTDGVTRSLFLVAVFKMNDVPLHIRHGVRRDVFTTETYRKLFSKYIDWLKNPTKQEKARYRSINAFLVEFCDEEGITDLYEQTDNPQRKAANNAKYQFTILNELLREFAESSNDDPVSSDEVALTFDLDPWIEVGKLPTTNTSEVRRLCKKCSYKLSDDLKEVVQICSYGSDKCLRTSL